MIDPNKSTRMTEKPNPSTEHQKARRPSDTLNKGMPSTEGQSAPKRKSSLT
jgi:hypothetical protein